LRGWRWIPIHLPFSPSSFFLTILQTTLYHLLPPTVLVSYHPLLTTWTFKFDRTPSSNGTSGGQTQDRQAGIAIKDKMPNNASARRDKDKKKKDKKKRTDPKLLHKEDKASQDSSSLSPSVAEKGEASLDKISLSLSSDSKRTSADSLDMSSRGALS
jgi:hypothetical protein